MTEDEFLARWHEERPSIEAWGKYVAEVLMNRITPLIAPVAAHIFVRIPAVPRVKGDGSILTKAFYRNKPYANPLEEITDKVGVRFVVLLGREITIVCRAIEECAEWGFSKDKDFEEDRANSPYEFNYQSVHYVVRTKDERMVEGFKVLANTPCEIQVRTLLQHAHSELTHDTIYKPSVAQTPAMLRAAAKSMALIEATSDYFEELTGYIERSVAPAKELSRQMAIIYRELIGVEPDVTKADGILNDAFAKLIGDKPVEAVHALFSEKEFLRGVIANRAIHKILFRQPSILLVYLGVANRSANAMEAWPFTPAELKPILTDLGIAAPGS